MLISIISESRCSCNVEGRDMLVRTTRAVSFFSFSSGRRPGKTRSSSASCVTGGGSSFGPSPPFYRSSTTPKSRIRKNKIPFLPINMMQSI